jgi:aubergine
MQQQNNFNYRGNKQSYYNQD